jgi:hypothetical protein
MSGVRAGKRQVEEAWLNSLSHQGRTLSIHVFDWRTRYTTIIISNSILVMALYFCLSIDVSRLGYVEHLWSWW